MRFVVCSVTGARGAGQAGTLGPALSLLFEANRTLYATQGGSRATTNLRECAGALER